MLALLLTLLPPLSSVFKTEFSRPTPALTHTNHLKLTIDATKDECAALVQRFELHDMLELSATCSLSQDTPSRVRVKGTITATRLARKNQAGEIATLDAISLPYENFFSPEEEVENRPLDFADPASFDEAIVDGMIDLGEMVAQELYVYLDELDMAELSEFHVPDVAAGTVVFDTDPDEEDDPPEPTNKIKFRF